MQGRREQAWALRSSPACCRRCRDSTGVLALYWLSSAHIVLPGEHGVHVLLHLGVAVLPQELLNVLVLPARCGRQGYRGRQGRAARAVRRGGASMGRANRGGALASHSAAPARRPPANAVARAPAHSMPPAAPTALPPTCLHATRPAGQPSLDANTTRPLYGWLETPVETPT